MVQQTPLEALAHAASSPIASVPPAAVAASTFIGFTPSQWLIGLSITWVLVQMGAFIYDRLKK